MGKTLKEARNDYRVYLIDKVEAGYEIWLNDGYIFDDGRTLQTVNSIKDIWNALDNEVQLDGQV